MRFLFKLFCFLKLYVFWGLVFFSSFLVGKLTTKKVKG